MTVQMLNKFLSLSLIYRTKHTTSKHHDTSYKEKKEVLHNCVAFAYIKSALDNINRTIKFCERILSQLISETCMKLHYVMISSCCLHFGTEFMGQGRLIERNM